MGVVQLLGLGLAVRRLRVMMVALWMVMVLVLRVAVALALLGIWLGVALWRMGLGIPLLLLRVALRRVALSVWGLLVRTRGVYSWLRVLLAILRRVLGGDLVGTAMRAVGWWSGGIVRGVRHCAVLCVVRSSLRLVALVRVCSGVLGVRLVVSACVDRYLVVADNVNRRNVDDICARQTTHREQDGVVRRIVHPKRHR
jgi:hypothetical protein